MTSKKQITKMLMRLRGCAGWSAPFCYKSPKTVSGFIRVREMSGKFKFFQGQRIVREFYVVSGKNECFLKCQGNVREF